MKKRCSHDEPVVVRSEVKLATHHVGKVHGPERMLKPRVVRPGYTRYEKPSCLMYLSRWSRGESRSGRIQSSTSIYPWTGSLMIFIRMIKNLDIEVIKVLSDDNLPFRRNRHSEAHQRYEEILCDEEISIVVNTAEDIWTGGSHLSPDIDTVMYLFSGDLNTDTWWGINGDTFVTHEQLIRLGVDEFIALGDRDRATNIARGELLRHGATLTEATKTLANALGVRASVLPMTDTDVTTLIRTGGRLIHFQNTG